MVGSASRPAIRLCRQHLDAGDEHGLAAEEHAVAPHLEPHDAPAVARLERRELVLAELRLPVRAKRAVAEPVTGSSFTPAAGAKNRDRKSNRVSSLAAVTITPRTGSVPSSEWFGASDRSVVSSATSTR